MAELLTDAELLHASLQERSCSLEETASSMQYNMNLVCEQHGIAPKLFYKSYDFYVKNPQRMQAVYTLVLQGLEYKLTQLH